VEEWGDNEPEEDVDAPDLDWVEDEVVFTMTEPVVAIAGPREKVETVLVEVSTPAEAVPVNTGVAVAETVSAVATTDVVPVTDAVPVNAETCTKVERVLDPEVTVVPDKAEPSAKVERDMIAKMRK
jgi:hypothetical protein